MFPFIKEGQGHSKECLLSCFGGLYENILMNDKEERTIGGYMKIDKTVYVAEGAKMIGDNITIGANSSIWYNSVIRCDENESIVIGEGTNIQDLSMMHTAPGVSVKVGNGVTIGHMCLIHGCTIGDNTLIGMGSVVMDNAVIGNNCIIGAGSLVTGGTVIPDGYMAFGRPAKVVKELTSEQIESNKYSAELYVHESANKL